MNIGKSVPVSIGSLVENNKNHVSTCMLNLMKYYSITGHIRSGAYGDVYAVEDGSHKGTKEYHKLATTKRKTPYIMKISSYNDTAMLEVKMLYEIKKIDSSHLPKIIKHYKCPSVKFRGWFRKGISKAHNNRTLIKKGNGLITIMENAGTGLNFYIKSNKNAMNEITMIFQLLHTLYVLEKLNIAHNDIHVMNIVCKKVHDKVMNYKIDNHVFKVPILEGHIPVLVDFGQSQVQNMGLSTDKYSLLTDWKNHTTIPFVKKICDALLDEVYSHESGTNKAGTKEFMINFYERFINTTV